MLDGETIDDLIGFANGLKLGKMIIKTLQDLKIILLNLTRSIYSNI